MAHSSQASKGILVDGTDFFRNASRLYGDSKEKS
jgi:hypothetical protein